MAFAVLAFSSASAATPSAVGGLPAAQPIPAHWYREFCPTPRSPAAALGDSTLEPDYGNLERTLWRRVLDKMRAGGIMALDQMRMTFERRPDFVGMTSHYLWHFDSSKGAYRLAGSYDTFFKRGVLRFDIEIEKDFQGYKLYSYFLARALRRFPNTRRIPTRMTTENSENARVFFKNLPSLLFVAPLKPLPKSVHQYLRGKILAATFAMPAVRVRAECGFKNITKIVIDLEKKEVAIDVGIGEAAAEPLIVIAEKSGIGRLTPEGEGLPALPESLQLNGYDDLVVPTPEHPALHTTTGSH